MIIDRRPRDDLRWFASLWPSVDPVALVADLERAMRRASSSAAEREGSLDPLETRWYQSLDAGQPDYGVYDDDRYIEQVWTSWTNYSRGYVKALAKMRANGDLRDVASVVDLGCGFGLSTLALAEVFYDAEVFGTNVAPTQIAVARSLGVAVEPALDREVDLVFASEYFEHFQRPLEHISEIVEVGNPRYIVAANAFGAIATGHFRTFLDGDRTIASSAMGRAWGQHLRSLGYRRVETGFWNNRPQLWQRSGRTERRRMTTDWDDLDWDALASDPGHLPDAPGLTETLASDPGARRDPTPDLLALDTEEDEERIAALIEGAESLEDADAPEIENVAVGQVTMFGSNDDFRLSWQEWKGMPEFNQSDLSPYRSITVHFATPEDVETFGALIGQKPPPVTSSRGLWFPKPNVAHFVDKRYISTEKKEAS